jgi:hypothetical protein
LIEIAAIDSSLQKRPSSDPRGRAPVTVGTPRAVNAQHAVEIRSRYAAEIRLRPPSTAHPQLAHARTGSLALSDGRRSRDTSHPRTVDRRCIAGTTRPGSAFSDPEYRFVHNSPAICAVGRLQLLPVSACVPALCRGDLSLRSGMCISSAVQRYYARIHYLCTIPRIH